MRICLMTVLTGCSTVKVKPTPPPQPEFHTPWMSEDIYISEHQVLVFPYSLTF
jgi:hypothetical protein